MRQEWSPEELLANWTLVDGDWDLLANKSGTTRLGFSLLLTFFELVGRFPDVLEDVPLAAVEYVAELVGVPAADFAKYTLVGRTAEYHRKQIREAPGFRPSTVPDGKALAEWLAVEVCRSSRWRTGSARPCWSSAGPGRSSRRAGPGSRRSSRPRFAPPCAPPTARTSFEATRAVHYAAIRQPLTPRAFMAELKKRMTAGLDRLSASLADGSADGVKVTTRKGGPWITVPKLEPLAEPTGLQALKDEVVRRRIDLGPVAVVPRPRTTAGAADRSQTQTR